MSQLIRMEHNEQEIALKVENKLLGDFVSSLLGQPQSIERFFTTPFYASHDYLVNLISLIEQRLSQQNIYTITSFQATIGFQDKTRRKLTTIEAFKSFSESLSLVSTDVNLNFGIIVNFPNKDIPEKQEIIIHLATSSDNNNSYARDLFDIALSKKEALSGIVAVEINHTERTWADDMLTMISNSLDDIWVKEPNYKKAFRWILSTLRLEVLLILLVLLAPFIGVLTSRAQDDRASEYSKYLSISSEESTSLVGVHKKLDFMSDKFFNTVHPTIFDSFTFFGFGVFVVTFIIFLIVVFTMKESVKPPPSFVALTKKTEKYMEEVLQDNKVNLWVLSFFGTIFTGIVISYTFEFLKFLTS